MKNNLPQIRIKYAWLLAGAASEPMNELWGDGKPLRPYEEYEEIVANYRKWWEPHEKKVLNGICDALGLEFRQNVIDVYVAPWFHAFSDPMVLGVIFDRDTLVMNLTHELIHRLLTDNISRDWQHMFADDWKKLFGELHNFKTLVHIPVHAVLKHMYLDILKEPSLLEADIEKSQKYTDYAQAWGYVEAHEYKDIVEKLKKQYGSK